MATANVNDWGDAQGSVSIQRRAAENVLWRLLELCGSLKLTVVLFALSLVLVFAGTVAQQSLNMVEVKARYFTAWLAFVRLDDLLPQAFIPHTTLQDWVGFPMPGGKFIGVLLLVNLLAAKITRFHIRATAARLALGLTVFGFGCVLCYFVVVLGNANGVQGEPPVDYKIIWSGLVAGMVVLWLAAVFEAFTSKRMGWRLIWGLIAVVFGGMGLASLLGYFSMSTSSLRITWQLIEGTIVATVLLIGSRIMFGQQGANLLLHFGVALLMVGQFSFGDAQLEQRLSLVEGQSTNVLVNLDRTELFFVEPLDDGKQRVTVIPEEKLKSALANGSTITDDRLPVDVRVKSFFDNSDVAEDTEPNPATIGTGLRVTMVEKEKVGGAKRGEDVASAYVELLDKQNAQPLGTYLVSEMTNDRKFRSAGDNPDFLEPVEVGSQKFEMGLRLQRVPKPYWVQVKDVRRINYSGTNTPRDYSSFIKLVDTESGNVENARVWMNNPLRYNGETFYQSDYIALPGGKEFTSIQVVRNAGWMIPYVACMIVAIGMIAHFSSTLDRFLGRQERHAKKLTGAESTAGAPEVAARKPKAWATLVMPVFCVLALVLSLVPWSAAMNALRPSNRNQSLDLYQAGELPVRYGGRVMPLDAYASITLRAISNKTSIPMKAKSDNETPPVPPKIAERAGNGRRLSALQWFFEVAGGSPEIAELHMIRIDADEVLDHFEIDRRKDNLYSLAQLAKSMPEFQDDVMAAFDKEENERSFKEQKFLELKARLNALEELTVAFNDPSLPPIPARFDRPDLTQEQRAQLQFLLLQQQMERLETAPIAAVIPPQQEATESNVDTPPWTPLAPVKFKDLIVTQMGKGEATATAETFSAVLKGYQAQDPLVFNEAVSDHLRLIGEASPRDYQIGRIQLERWIEAVHPTVICTMLYCLLLILAIVGLAIGSEVLRRNVWGGLVAVFAVHVFVVAARIYITGKAPVINLYSSAVFIGLATAVSGLVFERIFRRGVGNLLAGSTGMLTLLLAWGLELKDGDTMPVLQAVLDTQFWLATHVITISLGYAATLTAGMLGVIYIAILLFGGQGQKDTLRDVYRMAYAAACFGILFSFVGTVLGGLWADDSWGRFWGWDPKENGALLIVIWNALILHARWDGMVRDRGFMTLAVIGNIVTAWSWFGTNQLGIGLHNYGFTSGVTALLFVWGFAQLAVVGVGVYLIKTRDAAPE